MDAFAPRAQKPFSSSGCYYTNALIVLVRTHCLVNSVATKCKANIFFPDKSGVLAPAPDVAHLVRTPHLDTQSVPDLVRLLTHHARVLEGGKFIQKRPRRRSQLLKITGLMGRLTFGDPLLDSGAWQVLMNRVEMAKKPIRPEAGLSISRRAYPS